MSAHGNKEEDEDDDDEYDDEGEGEEEELNEKAKSKQKTIKTIRELPEVDIYEIPDLGDPDVDANVLQLQTTLKEKLKAKDLQERFIAYNDLGNKN